MDRIRRVSKGEFMSFNQLRGIVYVPIHFPPNKTVFNQSAMEEPELRPQAASVSEWLNGPLVELTESGIPSAPFNRSIHFDLPPQLRELLGFMAMNSEDREEMGIRSVHRKNLNFIDSPVSAGIDGLKCEAAELFKFPTTHLENGVSTGQYLLALHIVASDAPTNLENLISLTRLRNKPIRQVLNAIFMTTFQLDIAVESSPTKLPNFYDENIAQGGRPQVEFQINSPWVLLDDIEKTNCVIYESSDQDDLVISNGNLLIRDDMSDQKVAQFRSKAVFAGALVALLKAQSDNFQKQWPSLLEKTDSEVIELRSWLEQFMNSWWWKRISYNDFLQSAYQKWVSALSIEDVFESCRSDLREYWAIRTMQNSVKAAERSALDLVELKGLTDLAKLFAIFGIVPAWLGLFMSDLPKYVAPVASLVIVGYLALKPKKIVGLISRLQNRIKPE
jgi:hypothetical protein